MMLGTGIRRTFVSREDSSSITSCLNSPETTSLRLASSGRSWGNLHLTKQSVLFLNNRRGVRKRVVS